MDKGAHFHRCDFQVHTPRDPNWDGERPTTDEQRREFAKHFIAACRSKGIDAVAITDHHDFVFFPYIRDAAESETNSEGIRIPEEQRIAVFPGMELTLGVPCQALLILDQNFPVNLLPAILNVLAIEPNPQNEPVHAQTQQLSQIRDLTDLDRRLYEQPYLKGRYILLPNVTPEGYQTLHRQGFLSHYKTMPCVGGYTDGGLEKFSDGDWRIVNGAIEAYGNKAIGIFPTSDSRRSDFRDLGKHSAWVKWAEPTAEALRQACLAKDTRIAHVEPETPSVIIESIHVSNSKFMGPVDIEFNTQFNCIIGGRGTGKSTILEYLRWAMCDQPPAPLTGQELPDFQAKRKSLIENTLHPHNVTVRFNLNGVQHTVRRKSDTHEILLKVGDAEFQPVREDDLRDLLAIQAYSQKQLSAVGVRTEELLRFIQSPIKKQLNNLQLRVDELKAFTRSTYGLIQRKRQLERELKRGEIELDSQGKQLDALRARLKDLTDQDRQTLAQHDKYATEEQLIATWTRELEQLSEVVRSAIRQLTGLPTLLPTREQLQNDDLVAQMSVSVQNLFKQAEQLFLQISQLTEVQSHDMKTFSELRRAWLARSEAHTKAYEEVKQRASSQQKLIDEITASERRIKEITEDIARKRAAFAAQGTPETEFLHARTQWVNLHRARGDLLTDRCNQMTDLSSGSLRATLRRGAGTKQASAQLTVVLEGTGVRQQAKKIEDLCSQIAEALQPVDEWGRVLEELEQLALTDLSDQSTVSLPDSPTLSAAGFTDADRERIARNLTVERWLELSLVELEDVPVFEYLQREGDYIKFADASAGQQATALLRVLLNQKGPPLIIDQPEEDLDNEVVLEVVQEIWNAKKNRQIIVSSHNANIVVNGDADLVVVCAYRTAGDQSGGRIKAQGAIDVESIRKEITVVMEGGREAFRLRKEKYGF